jgi:hypothetical protein
LAVSPDGNQLLSASGFGDGAGSSGYAQLWSLPGVEPVGGRLRHESQVMELAFAEAPGWCASLSSSPEVSDLRLWSRANALPITTHITSRQDLFQFFRV